MKKTVPVQAYICLGSNLGDTHVYLEKARQAIAALSGVTITAVSGIYRTEPQGVRDQPFFANQVIGVSIFPSPGAEAFLEQILTVEALLGRSRENAERFGPRTIDIDLLLFGDARQKGNFLTLPHPRMHERAFVLVPLAEIAPEALLESGKNARDTLAELVCRIDGDTIYQD